MSEGTEASLGILNTTRFYISRLRERLWLKPLVSCILSLVAAFVSRLADYYTLANYFPVPDISAESIQTLLEIIAASMLVIAVFAVGAMLSAYASASNSATPRSFPLVVSDDVSQNALSTFMGAFIFSIVALAALLNDFYAQAGRFVLFCVMLFVFAMVILSFVRWVDRIARLGQMGNTIKKVEVATESALKVHASYPALGAAGSDIAGQGTAVYPESVGYIQNVDVYKLQCLAEKLDCSISLAALPGSFVTPGKPMAYFDAQDKEGAEETQQKIRNAFVVASQRTFELDPCFGLVVLSEIASRALSPAVNDCGTAIDIIGTLVRLFTGWSKACHERTNQQVKYDRVSLKPVSVNQMFDDAFNAISRDSASYVEVVIRLQEALYSLTLLGDESMSQTAIAHAKLSYRYAAESLVLKEEREALQAVAERCFQGFEEDHSATACPGRGNEPANQPQS